MINDEQNENNDADILGLEDLNPLGNLDPSEQESFLKDDGAFIKPSPPLNFANIVKAKDINSINDANAYLEDAKKEAARIIEDAQMRANQIIEVANLAAEKSKRKAYEQGFQNGESDFNQKKQAFFHEQIVRANNSFVAIENELPIIVEQIVTRIIGNIDTSTVAKGLIEGALSKLRAEWVVKVRVRPNQNEELAKQLVSQLNSKNFDASVTIDSSIEDGAVILSTPAGFLDVTPSHQAKILTGTGGKTRETKGT